MISITNHIEPNTYCEQNPDVRVSLPHSHEISEDPVSSHIQAYLKKLNLQKLFDELVTDPRSGQCKYTLSSLLFTALFNVQFLNESKNSFQTQAHQTPEIKEKISRFIGRGDGAFPITRTVDDVLEKLDFDELNNVLMQLFENVRLSKLFFEHDELIPGGEYHIAFDGEKIHTYSPDSDHDCKSCPYCLKRKRGDTTWVLSYDYSCITCVPWRLQAAHLCASYFVREQFAERKPLLMMSTSKNASYQH